MRPIALPPVVFGPRRILYLRHSCDTLLRYGVRIACWEPLSDAELVSQEHLHTRTRAQCDLRLELLHQEVEHFLYRRTYVRDNFFVGAGPHASTLTIKARNAKRGEKTLQREFAPFRVSRARLYGVSASPGAPATKPNVRKLRESDSVPGSHSTPPRPGASGECKTYRVSEVSEIATNGFED